MKFRDDKYDELAELICQMTPEQRDNPITQILVEVCIYFGKPNYPTEKLFENLNEIAPIILTNADFGNRNLNIA